MVGFLVPGAAEVAGPAVTPILALLLYATFLGVPFAKMRDAVRDWKFLTALLVVNFAVVPVVVFGVSRFVAHDQVLLVGVLFVLLTPCIDYVIVFTGLAGGARERLLAAAPLLMLVQLLLLPLYLWLFVGEEFAGVVEIAPFLEALLWLILVPLVAAAATQHLASRRDRAKRFQEMVLDGMVPLMMLTLAAVVASQVAGVAAELGALLQVIPLFLLFAAAMVLIGAVVGRACRFDVPGRKALIFGVVTRNSLVVLPLVLALPTGFGLAPLVVVTQTLVELLVMTVLVRFLSNWAHETDGPPKVLGA